MKNLSSNELTNYVANPGLTIIDFWAAWCGPCHVLATNLEQVEVEYSNNSSVIFAKFDIESDRDKAAEFNIKSLPTLVFFRGGQEVHRTIGVKSSADIKNTVKGLIN